MSTNKKMGDAHEGFLAALFEGIQNRGSGNQWRNPIDGRQSRKHKRFAFAWDGKSTLAKSISIPLAMWEKAQEQAGGDRPMLGLRWYANEKLDVLEDLVVIGAHDFAEVLRAAEADTPSEDEMVIELSRDATGDAHDILHDRPARPWEVTVNGVRIRPDDITLEVRKGRLTQLTIMVNGKRCLLPTRIKQYHAGGTVEYYDKGLLAEMRR